MTPENFHARLSELGRAPLRYRVSPWRRRGFALPLFHERPSTSFDHRVTSRGELVAVPLLAFVARHWPARDATHWISAPGPHVCHGRRRRLRSGRARE